MAIVRNLALNGFPNPGSSSDKDQDFCSFQRSNAGTPNAVLTPAFAGEIVWDSTNKVRWKATSLATNTGWRPLEAEVT